MTPDEKRLVADLMLTFTRMKHTEKNLALAEEAVDSFLQQAEKTKVIFMEPEILHD